MKPDSGKAYVLGHDSQKDSLKIRRRIGVLLEDESFPQNLSVYEYLRYVSKIKGYSIRKTIRICKEVGLYEYLDRKIKTLSAGMFKMLGLVQALIGDPELVILDEPTANLDPLKRKRLLNYIQRVHREKKVNFLISSHVLPELEEICNWAVFIYKGKAIDQGYLKDLYVKYSTGIYEIISDKPKVLAEYLKSFKSIDIVEEKDDVLRIKVKNYSELKNALSKALAEKSIQIISFRPLGGLREVFSRAVEKYSEVIN